MSKPDQLTPGPVTKPRDWTRLDHYLDLQRLRRRAGRRYRGRNLPRTQPAEPLFSLGMLPFMLLMTGMGLLAVMIIIAALPGKPRPPRPPATPAAEAQAEQIIWFEKRAEPLR
jgi:hypothetical protein